MKTCAKCGAASPDDSVFCGECGSALDAHDTSVSSGKATPATSAGPSVRGASPDRTVPGGPITAALRAPVPEAPPPPGPAAPPPAERDAGEPRGGLIAPPAGAPRGPAKPKHVPTGTVVDQKYRIERVIGEGGMGIVYLARDVHTGVEVVLKAIRNELAHRADVRERTMAEGRAIARIDHPNVVHLKAVVVDGQSLWLVMQYVDGESLEDMIAHHSRDRSPIPVPEVLRIFRQVLAGMAAVHRGGVIHRDLKPGNILIRAQDGLVKVSDFGIAKGEEDARAGRGQTRGIIGSLWYMSPEQVTGRRDLDKRVDVYALGIMLFEMLTGHVPFDAEGDYEIMRMHASSPVPLVSSVRPDARALDDVIQKALAKDRDQRYASCEEFAAALDRAFPTETAVPAPPPTQVPPQARHPAPGAAMTANDTRDGGGVSPGWTVFAIAVLLAGGALAAAIGFGVIDLDGEQPEETATAPTASGRPATTSAPGASATPTQAGIEVLQGKWLSDNGREFEAEQVGDAVEFRVVDPTQFEGQSYLPGEARFVLRTLPNEPSTFSVEDRLRPLPPAGHTYSANARSTCLSLWSSAAGRPLRAVLDGTRLMVDFAKVEPGLGNFVTDKDMVTGCTKLGSLRAARVPSVLNRAK
jgi:serine/threonine-protein kinase